MSWPAVAFVAFVSLRLALAVVSTRDDRRLDDDLARFEAERRAGLPPAV